MKVTRRAVTRIEITPPEGWDLVEVGESKPGDYWDSGGADAWLPCPVGVGCGNVAKVIRKRKVIPWLERRIVP